MSWSQLAYCSLVPEINLHVTALPPCPDKREMTSFQMDFTPHIQLSNKVSWLKLLCHQQTCGHSVEPSESRKGSDRLQAKLSCQRCHLRALSLITLVIKQQKDGRADLLNLLHQWPLPSREGCSGSEISAGKAHTLLFIQPLQLWASRTSPDKRAQHYL